ncbi:MAG: ABC transporter ATP-binding protein [Alphaproteobacteria bacterium]
MLRLDSVSQTFEQGKQVLHILKNVDLSINKGESVSIVGESGVGKTTLLEIMGLLQKPTSGMVSIDGQNCQLLSEKKRTMTRRCTLGFIYQFHHLLSEFSAIENVMIPLFIQKEKTTVARRKALFWLEQLGLVDRLSHKPSQLSGGEKQRVAIARALVCNPKIILADEPTGNLDSKTAKSVFHKILEIASNNQCSVLIATHNETLAKLTDRVVRINRGVLENVNLQ